MSEQGKRNIVAALLIFGWFAVCYIGGDIVGRKAERILNPPSEG